MKTALRQFLTRAFDGLFSAYEDAWIEIAATMAEEVRPLILADLGVKYPQFSESDNDGKTFTRLLEIDATITGPVLYRVAHAIYSTEPQHDALPYLAQVMRARTGMEIYYSAEIGPRFRVMHGTGLVLGPRHRIGSDFTIYQGATLGQRRNQCPEEFLTIGDRCTFFAGSAALGLLKIGDGVTLAANAVLLADAEPHSTYAGAPAVKVK